MSPEREQDHNTLEEIISNAKEIMLRYGHHVPTLIMEASKNFVISQIPSLPVTHAERMEFMSFIGQVVAKSGRINQLQQVFLVSEGWMSIANEDKAAHVPPSQDPEKKEVLVISGIQIKERKKEVKLFEIRRDNNGKVTNLQEFPPEEKKEGSVDVPLLDAFIDGFKTAYLIRYN